MLQDKNARKHVPVYSPQKVARSLGFYGGETYDGSGNPSEKLSGSRSSVEQKGNTMDNKKYYYLKLKEDFFESDSMILLENMRDGYLYSNILLKLYLRSLKDDGRLMLNGAIPYNSQMLASVTRHQVGTVEKALNVFQDLGLIEVLDSGAIYMMDIQNFVGESSNEADRKRAYRARIEKDKCPDKNPTNDQTNLHQRIEYRDKSIENRESESARAYGRYQNVS